MRASARSFNLESTMKKVIKNELTDHVMKMVSKHGPDLVAETASLHKNTIQRWIDGRTKQPSLLSSLKVINAFNLQIKIMKGRKL